MVIGKKFILLLLNVVLIMTFCLGWMVTVTIGINNNLYSQKMVDATLSSPLPYSGNALLLIVAVTLGLIVTLNIAIYRKCS